MKLPVVDTWYRDGLSFECTQCGNCCTGGPGYVWMSDVEVGRLAEYLKLSVGEVRRRYLRKLQGRVSLRETKTEAGLYDCVFLTTSTTSQTLPDGSTREATKRGCAIYPVRPLQCRTWPFWDGLLSSRDSWERARRMCPGMDKGRAYTAERIEELRTAKDWPESPPTSAAT